MKIIPTPVKRFMSSSQTAEFVENTIFAVSVETCLKMVGRPTFIFFDKEADSPEKRKYASVKEFLYQATCLLLYFTIVPFAKRLGYNAIRYFLSKNPENTSKLDIYDHEHEIMCQAMKTDKAHHKTFMDRIKGLFINGPEVRKIKQQNKAEAEIFDICDLGKCSDKLDCSLDEIIAKVDEYKTKVGSEHLTELFNNVVKKIETYRTTRNPKELLDTLSPLIDKVKAQKFGKGAYELAAIFASVVTLAIIAPELSHFIVHPMMKLLGFDKKADIKKDK
ncbi:MAG: hypothetical protein PHC64_05165 [Candidatus Gastranaerophilales bacterium]|nr:hypothetical protein [Candidatus Gastranaerophilales bacterium]